LESDNPRLLALEIINLFSKRKSYLNLLLTKKILQTKLGQQQKDFISELVYGTVIWQKKLDWIIDSLLLRKNKWLEQDLRNILRLGIYQLQFLTRTKEYASVHETVEIARLSKGNKYAGFVNGLLRNFLRNKEEIEFPDIEKTPVEGIAVNYSYPDWIIKRWLKRYGKANTIQLCEYNNLKPEIKLCYNSNIIEKEKFINFLKEHNIDFGNSLYHNDFFIVRDKKILDPEILNEGFFYIQDDSYGIALELIDYSSVKCIYDLCSAPGGKIFFISHKTKNEIRKIAIDINLKRLQLLKENIKRLKIKNIHILNGDCTRPLLKPGELAIVDVPCSGLGVIRKKPEIRWLRKESDIKNLQNQQLEILKSTAQMIKKGGKILYMTCTTEPEENEDIIDIFLHKNKNFEIEEINSPYSLNNNYLQLHSFNVDMDSIFAAKLRRYH